MVAAALFTVLVMPAMADQRSGEDIKNTLSGKTAVGDHLKNGLGVKSFHATDGSYKSVLSDGKVRTGKWWVKDDYLCIRFDGKGKDRCRHTEADGNGGYKKIAPKKGKVVVHSRSLADGDHTQ